MRRPTSVRPPSVRPPSVRPTSVGPAASPSAGIASLAALVVPCVTTVVLWAVFLRADVSSAAVIGLICSFVCVRQIVLAVTEPSSGPVGLVFWTFLLGWMCIGSLAQLGSGVFPWPDSGLESLFPWAQLLLLGAMLSYVAGARIAAQRPYTVRSSVGGRLRPLLVLLVGVLMLVPVLQASGGLAARFTTRGDVYAALAEAGVTGDNVTLFLLNRLPAAVAMVAAYGAAHAFVCRFDEGRRPRGRTVALVVAVVLLVVLANPFSNPRYLAFSALAATVLGLWPLTTRHRREIALVGLLVVTLVAYPLATWFKKKSTSTQLGQVDLSTFSGIDFDGYQMSVNALSYVRDNGFAFGEHILAAAAFFVPRSLWSAKPMPASLDVAADRGYAFLNLSLPLWAELYIDLGVVGVVLGMGLLGYVSRRLDLAYASQDGSLGQHMAVLVAVAQVGLLRGPLGGSVVFFGTVVAIGWWTFRQPRSARAPARTAEDPRPAAGVRPAGAREPARERARDLARDPAHVQARDPVGGRT